jgi:ATP-dependent Clp protease adaptor protein ClpS
VNPVASAPVAEPREETVIRRMPLYNVILLNDDHHSFGFVIAVLRKVFGVTDERAFELASEAHHSGRAVVWTGLRERAELKADQMLTFREVRDRDNADLGPVGVLVEPAPTA